MKTISSIVTIVLLVGCGSPTPFQRGQKKDDVEPSPVIETAGRLSEKVYMERVFPLLERDCTVCHNNPAPDFNKASSLVVFQKPEESQIYLRPSGGDEHEVVWAAGSKELQTVRSWIMGDAPPAHVALAPPPTAKEIFEKDVSPNIQASCVRCHANPAPTYEVAKTKIVPKDAPNSLLYQKATGVGHKQVWTPDSTQAKNMKNWIDNES